MTKYAIAMARNTSPRTIAAVFMGKSPGAVPSHTCCTAVRQRSKGRASRTAGRSAGHRRAQNHQPVGGAHPVTFRQNEQWIDLSFDQTVAQGDAQVGE